MVCTFPRYLVVLLVMSAVSLLSQIAVSQSNATFDYTEGPKGPANWGSVCKNGTHQSPIDILTAGLIPESTLDKLKFEYNSAEAMVLNNREHLQLEVEGEDREGFGTLEIQEDAMSQGVRGGSAALNDNETYYFTKFHFHSPSEHTIDGKSYPLELHLFHTTPTGKRAVVGILFREGAESPFLAEFWKYLPDLNILPHESEIDFSVLPLNGSYARYEGSLTTPTPTCAEPVTWIVLLNEDITMSVAQLEQFKKSFPGVNNRPVQPLNGRKVVEYKIATPSSKSDEENDKSSSSNIISTCVANRYWWILWTGVVLSFFASR